MFHFRSVRLSQARSKLHNHLITHMKPIKFKLPVIPAPKHICKDLKLVLNDKHVLTFITFAVLAGMLDALIIYFFFWYLEDLAMQTNTPDVKLIEGLILAAETLGAEVIFFSLSGRSRLIPFRHAIL